MTRPQTKLGIGIFALIAAASFWLLQKQRIEDTSTGPAVDTQLDYAMQDFTSMSFAPSGELKMSLRSPQLTNAALGGQGKILNPRIKLHYASHLWHLAAQDALINPTRTQVEFNGDVTITLEDTEPLQVTTQNLLVDTIGQIASTESATTITQSGSTVTGDRVKVLLAEKKIEMDNIKGFYAIQ